MQTRKSLLFLLWIDQPGSTTMPAAVSERVRYNIFWAEYSTGAGKNDQKPEIHDENIVLVAQRPVKEMRKLKLFR